MSRGDFEGSFVRVDEEQLFARLMVWPRFGVDFHGCHRDWGFFLWAARMDPTFQDSELSLSLLHWGGTKSHLGRERGM